MTVNFSVAIACQPILANLVKLKLVQFGNILADGGNTFLQYPEGLVSDGKKARAPEFHLHTTPYPAIVCILLC
jgi:hypothetical protein